MGFPSEEAVLQSAKRLCLRDNGTLTRTNGFWHVLMFLRHQALHGRHRQYTFEVSYDLAEAAFDLNGVLLPIEDASRNVYFEPAATQGTEPVRFFRHREGPRQTYLNRIYTGLAGAGPRQPKLFDTSSNALPATINLVTNWVQTLRQTGDNAFILDERTHDLITWLFRFGIPHRGADSARIAEHLTNGKMRVDPGTQLRELPAAPDQLASELCKFLALTPAQLNALLPQLARVRPAEWAAQQHTSTTTLGPALLRQIRQWSAGAATTADLSELVPAAYKAFTEEAALRSDPEFIARFVAALAAKPFLILTGLSGSGKTKLAQALAHWITPDPGWIDDDDHAKGKKPNPYYALVPVGADWTGNENILGYPDGLRPPNAGNPGNYITKPALDLIRHAADSAQAAVPHFLILDEMNLSHVERYFADLLSMIESDEGILLYCDEKDSEGNPKTTRRIEPWLKLPNNLFIIGTVNVDETTYMFSPKVLDRANVIEFRVPPEEMKAFLADPKSAKLDRLDERGVAFGAEFIPAAADTDATVPEEVKARFQAEMELCFSLLREHGVEFGYRVANETGRFLHFYKSLCDGKVWRPASSGPPHAAAAWAAGDQQNRDWFDRAFDAVILQKLLPKLHGSKAKLSPLLRKLYTAAIEPAAATARDAAAKAGDLNDPGKAPQLKDPSREIPQNARYPLTAEKLFRMWRQLNENGFTSFAEN